VLAATSPHHLPGWLPAQILLGPQGLLTIVQKKGGF